MHIIHITNNCNRGGANHVLLPIIEELVDKNIKFTLAYIQGPELLKNEFNFSLQHKPLLFFPLWRETHSLPWRLARAYNQIIAAKSASFDDCITAARFY